mgnify:CR=1 FL=1
MKILYVNNNKVAGDCGGSIGSQKFFCFLKRCKEENKIEDFLIFSPDNFPSKYNFAISKKRSLDFLSRLIGKSNFLYFYMIKYKKYILDYAADTVIIQNSRLGFFAKFYKHFFPKSQIICNFDNIEYDYSMMAIRKPFNILERIIVKKCEKESIVFSDKLCFLTERDFFRAKNIYGRFQNLSIICPVSLPFPSSPLIIHSVKPTIVFLGKLDYLPNKEAVSFLICNILPKIKRDHLDVIVAGANPDNKLKHLCSQYHVRLIGNFSSTSVFIPIGSALISPLLSGFGMKTKIAEALSLGMFVIGSKESLVGYSKAENPNCVCCHTLSDYILAINYYTAHFTGQLYNSNIEIYKQFYSMDSFYFNFWDFLTKNEKD